ncbi:hypothetical protein BHM03_00051984 [Ensete ventricosum]|nr:hypothetical protein BHM03_00051984 [Ensete ventricosum]
MDRSRRAPPGMEDREMTSPSDSHISVSCMQYTNRGRGAAYVAAASLQAVDTPWAAAKQQVLLPAFSPAQISRPRLQAGLHHQFMSNASGRGDNRDATRGRNTLWLFLFVVFRGLGE